MASPPKPWERAGAATSAAPAVTSNATASSSQSTSASSNPSASPVSSSTAAQPAQSQPSTLASAVNQNAAAYSRIPPTTYGSYSTAYSAPYAAPYSYNRYGGYGGFGGSMYGGAYGGGYGGMYGGGMYGGMPGVPGNPNDPNSLTNRFSQSTATTFQMLEGLVNAFGGFAQMLESTYMATHSSFFAMVSVAEQFGNLRDTLGSILGIFALIRWLRTIFAKITGRPPPADATALTPAAFARFEGRQPAPGTAQPGPPRASRKPLLFFLLAAFGLPYLMGKVIKSLAATREEERQRIEAGQELQLRTIDPSQLEFCRVMFDFTPQGQVVDGIDMAVRKDDLVAVLAKTDPYGQPSDWWRCRTRDGRMGYLPSAYLEVVRRPGQQAVAAIKATAASDSSRANSLTSVGNTATQTPVPIPVQKSVAAPLAIDDFQKSQFYS